MSAMLRCPHCQRDFPASASPVHCPFCQGDVTASSVLTLSDEQGSGADMHLGATLACLQNVELLETGGIRDAVAGVIGRYRESFRTIDIRAPRPRSGAVDLSCTCPICGQTIRLRVKSRLRTALPYLLGIAALGLGVAVLGWLNVASVGNIALGVAMFGVILACVPPLLMFVAPGLLDNLSAAFQIIEDVPRAESLFIHKGPHPSTSKHSELLGLGRNQHKLEEVRRLN